MKFNDIDRFIESHDATLANITVILYERLGCTQDESHDYILDKLREIQVFDSSHSPELKWESDVVLNHDLVEEYIVSSHPKFKGNLY